MDFNKYKIEIGLAVGVIVFCILIGALWTIVPQDPIVGATPSLRTFQGGTGTSTTATDGNLLCGDTNGQYGKCEIVAGSGITIATTTASDGLGTITFSTSLGSFSYPFPSNATSTLLTFNGGLISPASSTMQLLSVGFSTTTGATTTDLYVSNTLNVVGTLDVDGLTSALVLTGATGVFAEYAGTSCTNQFVRSLSALGVATCATVVAGDVDLADLTAGDSSLTLSGTYDGQTARTIILNVGNANTWTALQTFSVGLNAQASSTIVRLDSNFSTSTQATSTNLRVTSLGSFANLFIDTTGNLFIPASANPTISTTGDTSIDTTQASTSIRFYDGTGERQLSPIKTISIPIRNASTTIPTVGTTTIELITFQRPVTLLEVYCNTNSWKVPQLMGTTTIRLGDGNNFGEYIMCGNASSAQGTATSTAEFTDQDSINDDDGSLTNNTFVFLETLYLQAGNWTGTADDLKVTIRLREDAD